MAKTRVTDRTSTSAHDTDIGTEFKAFAEQHELLDGKAGDLAPRFMQEYKTWADAKRKLANGEKVKADLSEFVRYLYDFDSKTLKDTPEITRAIQAAQYLKRKVEAENRTAAAGSSRKRTKLEKALEIVMEHVEQGEQQRLVGVFDGVRWQGNVDKDRILRSLRKRLPETFTATGPAQAAA